MSSHEVITIQAGRYANFIGTHWWNMQEASFCYSKDEKHALDIDHTVLFREGLNPQNEVTFTPRLLVIDTKATFENLSKIGPLYRKETNESSILWDGPTEVIKENSEDCVFPNVVSNQSDAGDENQPRQEKGQSLPISSERSQAPSTKISDFLYTYLHPRSVCLIDDCYVTGSESAFDSYTLGIEAYTYKPNEEIIEDKLRQYIEECDYLQGFHIITEGDNAFGGVSSCLMQHLSDEYSRKTKIGFPVFGVDTQTGPDVDTVKLFSRVNSMIFSLNSFSHLSSLFSPLSLSSDIIHLSSDSYVQFPLLKFKADSMYHTSGILATALENVTAAYRLKQRKFDMPDIVQNMVICGRKLVSSGLCFPLNVTHDFESSFNDVPGSCSIQPVTPRFNPEDKSLVQSAILRGVPGHCFKSIHNKCVFGHPHHNVNKDDMFGQYLAKHSPSALSFVKVFEEKCFIPKTFPNIFNVIPDYSDAVQKDVKSVAVAATMSNSNSGAGMLEQLLSFAKDHQKQVSQCFAGWQIERDDFHEAVHDLMVFQENYGSQYSM